MQQKIPQKVLLKSFDFEVFGKVQGVFFRKFTEEKAKKLNLNGWVQNTPQGTVIGTVQGPQQKCLEMENWLKNVGSPKSKIENFVKNNEVDIQQCTFKGFKVKK
ncbi:hypothetical protein pb186bvf_009577 [Paramecium bursaria]